MILINKESTLACKNTTVAKNEDVKNKLENKCPQK